VLWRAGQVLSEGLVFIQDHNPNFQDCRYETCILVFERCLGGSGHVCSRLSRRHMSNYIE